MIQKSQGSGQGIQKQNRPGQGPPRLPPRIVTWGTSGGACWGSITIDLSVWPGLLQGLVTYSYVDELLADRSASPQKADRQSWRFERSVQVWLEKTFWPILKLKRFG